MAGNDLMFHWQLVISKYIVDSYYEYLLYLQDSAALLMHADIRIEYCIFRDY